MKTEDDSKNKPRACNRTDTKCPNALILGDSISIGYTPVTAKILDGQVNVFRPEANCGSTLTYREHLDAWLDDKHWDIIHFNCGLHDINRSNNEEFNRVGKRRVTLEEYTTNLNIIADRIKEAASIVIWASTTPVPAEASNRVPGDEVEYNKAAEKIMRDQKFIINDLYSFILPSCPECHPALDNVHYTEDGYKKLGAKVAESITNALFPKS